MIKLLVIMILGTVCCAQSVKYTAVVKNGSDGVDGLLSPASIAVSPDNKNVYVGCYSGSALVVFDRVSSTGSLLYKNCIKYCVNGENELSGAIFVAVSPDNKNVYVTGASDNAVAVYDRDSLTGALTYKTSFKNGTAGVNGLSGANAVIVSPDNKNVYVTGGKDNALVVFTRNTENGELTYNTFFKNGTGGVNGLYGVMSIAICANGQSVYCSGDNGISVFTRDIATGALSWNSDYLLSMKDGPMSTIRVSTDNKNVYTLDGINHMLSEFKRDTVTGAISYAGGISGITFGGNNVLWGATSLCISPDDRNAFVTGSDSTIILLNRNMSTGSLGYDTCLQKGLDGVDGLRWASACTVSPDNKNLYVLGPGDSSIAIFTITDTTKSSAIISTKNPHSSKMFSVRVLADNKTIMVRTLSKATWTLCSIDGRVVRTGIFQYPGQYTITGIQCGVGLFKIKTAGGQCDLLRFTVE